MFGQKVKDPKAPIKTGYVLSAVWFFGDSNQKDAEKEQRFFQKYFSTRQAKYSGHMMPALSGKWEKTPVPTRVCVD